MVNTDGTSVVFVCNLSLMMLCRNVRGTLSSMSACVALFELTCISNLCLICWSLINLAL